jgi:hypothetical protein
MLRSGLSGIIIVPRIAMLTKCLELSNIGRRYIEFKGLFDCRVFGIEHALWLVNYVSIWPISRSQALWWFGGG